MDEKHASDPIIRELGELAKQKPLRGNPLTRAKTLMATLMEMDFTN